MDDKTKALIQELFPEINDKVLSLISAEAYDRGHSAGQEEVNAIALNLAFFVKDILKRID